VIISLLGPNSARQPKNTEYADYYRTIVSFMKEHNVRRIFAMGTISIYQPEDRGSLVRFLLTCLIRILAPGAYHNIIATQKLFEDGQTTSDIEWTVYRLGNLAGSSDEKAWLANRGDEAYAGPLGAAGWTSSMKRATLARWLVDAAESGAPEWIRRMPAVSQLAGSN
jgi:hypothetical protein